MYVAWDICGGTDVFFLFFLQGRWDVSAAGHIEAGGDSFECATRELEEELGIVAGHSELEFVASVQAMATGETKLHGKYKDNEIQDVYVYWPSRTVSIDDMRLQEEEVERVEYWKWNDYQARSLANDDLLVPRSPMYKRIVFPWISRQMALPTDSGV